MCNNGATLLSFGGRDGIRTHEGFAPLAVFKTAACDSNGEVSPLKGILDIDAFKKAGI